MAYSNSRRQAQEYYAEYQRKKELDELRKKQQQYGLGNYYNDTMDVYNNTKGVYDNVTGIGNRLNNYGTSINNLGSKLSQSQRPSIANLGNRIQGAGSKLQGWGSNLDAAKTNGTNSIANKFQDFLSKYKTSANTGASPVSTGAFGGTAQGMAGNLGIGGTQAGGGMLGNAIAGQTAGTTAGVGAGSSGGMLGSTIAGQTAGTGASAAGSGGALAGAIGAQTGGTAAATGASAGGIAAGSGASAGMAGGAAGAAGGAAMAIPVAGWVLAAAAAAKMIKDKIDAAHKKVNAKAMQADAENMQRSASANQEVSQTAQKDLQEQAAQDTAAMGAPAEAQQQQGYAGQLPDMSAYQSSDELSDNMIDQLRASEQQETQPQMTGNGVITGGAAPVQNAPQIDPVVLYDDNFSADKQPLKNWDANTWNAISEAKANGINDGTTLNAMTQGLNSGNKDIANIIDKYSIQKPSNQEEIKEANAGTFNLPQQQQVQPQSINMSGISTKDDLMQRIANGIKNFQAGYKDNANSSFTQGDLYNNALGKMNPSVQNGVLTGGAAQTKKTFMNRLGELAGTGQRILANPLTQGAIAGTIAGIQDGDIGTGLKTAYDWAGNKAKSNAYYRKLHPNSNYTPVFSGNYDADDYKAQSMVDYQTNMSDIRQQQQNDSHAKDFGKAGEIWEAYKGTDPEYYNEVVNNPDFDPDAEISKNDVKNYIEARRKQNKDTFDKQNKKDTLNERIRHGKAMEGIGYGNLGLRQQAYNDSKEQRDFDNSLKLTTANSRNHSIELKNAKSMYEEKIKAIDAMDFDEDEKQAVKDELARKYNTKLAAINNKYSNTQKSTSTNTSTNTVKPQKVKGGLAF